MTDEPAVPSASTQAAPSAGPPLAGRVIAVTGAGRGIGRAVAETLARAGGAVALGDLDGVAARSAAGEISRSADVRAEGFALDVTDSASFAEFLDRAEERFGPVDVLVNNAGILWVGAFAQETERTALRFTKIFSLGNWITSRGLSVCCR